MTVYLESTTERLEAGLRRLAVEAGDLFDQLLREGAELPFEIEPIDNGPLPMYQYSPLTGDFIRRHAAELRRLEAFVEVRDLAGEDATIGFLVGLWEGRGEFTLVEDHLRGAIDAVRGSLSGKGGLTAAGEVIVPLIGFHMPADEIVLDGVRIMRAELVEDAPLDAIELSRSGRKDKGGFIARVSCAAANVAPAAAIADDLRRALRAMRLFRPGAVGLAAHGWVRRPDGWERFSTGAGRARHGGYRLTGNEAADLEGFAGLLASRGARIPALDWAISRFDLGAERPSLIEALSDYLLAIRGLLAGGGPARASLAARVGALVAEGAERDRARVCVDEAIGLERKLMGGSRFVPAAGSRPLEVIAELEDLLRRILRSMVTGELGGDLRATADEILLADGLRAGETASPMGETAEWSLPELQTSDEAIAVLRTSEAEAADAGAEEAPDEESQATTRIVVEDVELPDLMADRSQEAGGEEIRRATTLGGVETATGDDEGADWFSSSEGDVEWPAFARPRRDRGPDQPERGEPSRSSERVRYLFPVPDATDWDVGELRYERKRSARTS